MRDSRAPPRAWPATRLGRPLAEGTSCAEIGGPPRCQPTRSSQVRGWYVISGSYVSGQRQKNAASPYSAQPGNMIALENQSIVHWDIGAVRSSWCFRQFDTT